MEKMQCTPKDMQEMTSIWIKYVQLKFNKILDYFKAQPTFQIKVNVP